MKTWNEQFLDLFDKCLKLYRGGDTDYVNYYDKTDLLFLGSIGYKPREMFDFVEDFANEGVPAVSTALIIASVRRDYFLSVQKGIPDESTILLRDQLPTFGDELDGIAYLPRIIAKARGKLKGQLDPDIMFSCGGDRNFLSKHGNIHPADFLRNVWAAHDDDMAIACYVRSFM